MFCQCTKYCIHKADVVLTITDRDTEDVHVSYVNTNHINPWEFAVPYYTIRFTYFTSLDKLSSVS